MCVYVYIYIYMNVYVYVWIYVFMCVVCMYVCMYVYIYIYTSEDLSLYSDIVRWCCRLVFGRCVDSQPPLSKHFFHHIVD